MEFKLNILSTKIRFNTIEIKLSHKAQQGRISHNMIIPRFEM